VKKSGRVELFMLPLLYSILILEGFITISIEIITIRQLIPFYGNSVIITSIIIGIFLLFLALGYWRGGTWTSDFFKRLSRNFVLSMFWIGLGLNYSCVSFFYYFLNLKLKLSMFVGLGLYLVMVLAPIVFWLGQTIPLTTNLFQQQQRISRINGHALFWSTAGSFLGALITSLVLFQFFGVAWTIVFNCLLLFALIILLKPHSTIQAWHIILLGTGLFSIKILNLDIEKTLFQLTNNYANYRVMQTNDYTRHLEINMANSSVLTAENTAASYIEFIRKFLFQDLQLQHKAILVIGAGGFTLSAQGTEHNKITYIDIDPKVKDFSEHYFLKHLIHGQFIGEDARFYLNHSTQQFDVIVSDVYSHQSSIPASLLTKEYFQQLARHLHNSGFLLVNIIANPFFHDQFSQRVANTIHSVFKFCSVVPLKWQRSPTNIIYICSKLERDPKIYTDNLNAVTYDFFTQS
jgi:spermidine synthase